MVDETLTCTLIVKAFASETEGEAESAALVPKFSLVGEIIALRQATGLSQREFAERVGIKQPQLARLEAGRQVPKLETLSKLAAAAGYEVKIHFVPAMNTKKQKEKGRREQ
jgi:transcriptional regulator with XRE-family HTH domain